MGGEFPANSNGVQKNNRCDIFARLKRGPLAAISLGIIGHSPFLWPATPPRPAESADNDEAATPAVSKRLEVFKNNATNFPFVGGLYYTREAVYAE
jgi:hypothetical protein